MPANTNGNRNSQHGISADQIKAAHSITAAVALVFFLAAESLLKASVPQSSLKTAAFVVGAASISYLLYYFVRTNRLWQSMLAPSQQTTRSMIFMVLVIFVIGTVFRFWRLGTFADGMAWDEAYKGLDAIAIRELGDRPIFLNWNAGREALIAYLVAVSQWFFDYSIVSVRAVLAFFGVLTLVAFYFFCRRIFTANFALLATFLLAVSKWHIIHTRYAVRVGLIVFFEIIVLYFVARGLQSQKKSTAAFVLAGIFGGLGLYTYIAYRIFPLVAFAFLLDPLNRSRLKEKWKGIAAGAFAALIVAAPLLHFYWQNRVSFTDRMERTAIWNARGTELTPSELVADSAAKTFGLFTWRGDSIARHNLYEEPMLSPFASGLFLLGLALTIINFRKPYAAFLIVYLFLTILPGILSVNAPHSSRTLGSVIPAIVFSGIGLFASIQILSPLAGWLATLFSAAILAGNFYTGPNDALLRYSAALDHLDAKTSALWGVDRDQYRAVQLLNSLGPKIDAYVSPQFYFHSTVEYLTYSKSVHKLYAPGMSFQNSWQENKIPVVIIQSEPCNLWWLRDDDRKQFFKWWDQVGPYDVKRIRSIINRSYVNYSRTTNMSDWRMIESIRKNNPDSRELKLGSFSVFVISPRRPR